MTNPHLSILPASALFIFIFLHSPTPSSSQNEKYSTCSESHDCAGTNITFPFWGGNRPQACGFPGFELSCSGNSAVITMEDLDYLILGVDDGSSKATVARADYSESHCLSSPANTTFDYDLFSYDLSADENLTLHYNCEIDASARLNLTGVGSFNCSDGGGYFVKESSVTGAVGSALSLVCGSSVFVPALKSAVRSLSGSSSAAELVAALKEGFELKWSAENDLCGECRRSGGACGYDTSLSAFACHCGNGTTASTCYAAPSPGVAVAGGSSKETPQVVGISIASAAIFGIFIGFLIFYFRNRRKKRAAKSESRDLPVTKLLKATDTPTTNYFRGNPPVPSSKFEFEKGSTYFGLQVFSYAELEEATGNFDSSRELGDGGFGTVYYGVLKDGRAVAVKRLYENNLKRVEQFINEVEILTHLRHQNLVVLYGCTSKQSRELLLVYEYIPNLTVADHLHGKKANSGLLTWQVRLKIAIETADALAYLHKSDIIHRDVKTTNILLDNSFRVKVADFGLSRLFPTDVTHVSTAPQGTPGYVDPEYYQCYQLTDKSDVYSFGVVLVELISSKPAVDTGRHRQEINLANMAINKIQSHALHELVDPSLPFESDYTVRRMATLVAELAFRCLQQERDMRPSMEEVVEMLREIEKEIHSAQKPEVVDIRVQEAGPTKNPPPPLSPDSAMTDKWASTSTTATSF